MVHGGRIIKQDFLVDVDVLQTSISMTADLLTSVRVDAMLI